MEELKPRLLVFTTAYHPLVGGAEVAVREVSKRLSGTYDIVIITSRFKRSLPKQETVTEGTIVRVGLGTPFDKWLLPFAGALAGWRLRGPGITTLWGMDISQGALAAALLRLWSSRTWCVLTVQYGYGDERLATGRFGMLDAAFRFLLKHADHVTVISSYLKRTVLAYGYKGPIDIIHNGVDPVQFSPAVREPSSVPTIITTSRLIPKNGVDILIKAIAEVKRVFPNVRCLIAGDGPERKSLERLSRELDTARHISFLGLVPYDRLPGYLRESDIFVRMSRFEGMGNSFVEALAVGVPIIGTRVGGIPDIIEDNVTGLFANTYDSHDCAEKIKILLSNPDLGKKLAEEGIKRVAERFTWDGISDAYRNAFTMRPLAKESRVPEAPTVGPHLPASVPARTLPAPEIPVPQPVTPVAPAVIEQPKVSDVPVPKLPRIIIATGVFPPEIGGPATYSKLMADELPGRGFDVIVLPFSTVRQKPKIIRHIAYARLVFQEARRSDIVFAQDPVSVGFPAAIVCMLLRKRFVLKIVGDYAWEQGTQRFGITDELDIFLLKHYGGRVGLLRWAQAWTAHRAWRIITPSYYLRGVVRQWHIPEDRITVIYNAFEAPASLPDRASARTVLGWNNPVLISAGRLVPWKGFRILIVTIGNLLKDVPNLSLMIAGSGPDRETLEDEIRTLQLQDHVKLVGQVEHDQLLSMLSASDVFCLNTAYEGLSHTILEAMALGVPVVTTSAGGNPEIIKDGETGVLVPYNNVEDLKSALRKVLTDHEFAGRLAKAGKERVAFFDKEKMLRETTELLKTICES